MSTDIAKLPFQNDNLVKFPPPETHFLIQNSKASCEDQLLRAEMLLFQEDLRQTLCYICVKHAHKCVLYIYIF